MKKLLYCTLITIFIYVLSFPVFALENIPADAYILIDSQTGYVIREKNSKQQFAPASTTKIMTAILALEKGKLSDLYTASQRAITDIGIGGMNIGIMEGEQLPLEDLLNALLVRSANETANIIAENLAGSNEEFVQWMNHKAKEIGATNTNFTNTFGIDKNIGEKEHLSSAEDLAKMAQYAMKIPVFREIVSKTSTTIRPTNKHEKEVVLGTTNKLLFKPYESELFQVTGIKTGYTSKAGHVLVSAAKNQEGMELIAVIMGMRSGSNNSIFSYSKKLLENGFQTIKIQSIAPAGKFIKYIELNDGQENQQLNIITQKELLAPIPKDQTEKKITSKITLNPILLPVNRNDVVGQMEYFNQGSSIGRVNLIAANTIVLAPKSNWVEITVATIAKILASVLILSAAIIIWIRWSHKPLKKKVGDKRRNKLFMNKNYRSTTWKFRRMKYRKNKKINDTL